MRPLYFIFKLAFCASNSSWTIIRHRIRCNLYKKFISVTYLYKKFISVRCIRYQPITLVLIGVGAGGEGGAARGGRAPPALAEILALWPCIERNELKIALGIGIPNLNIVPAPMLALVSLSLMPSHHLLFPNTCRYLPHVAVFLTPYIGISSISDKV